MLITQSAVTELILTEKSYLVDLTDICCGYYNSLENCLEQDSDDAEPTKDQIREHKIKCSEFLANHPDLKSSPCQESTPPSGKIFDSTSSLVPILLLSDTEDKIAEAEDDAKKESSPLLTKNEITVLFANIRELHQFHQRLYLDLENYQLDIPKIAELFISREEGFVTLYSFYCANYPNAVSLLSDLIQNNRAVFKKFQQIQAEMGHALPLGSYILKPVQRILKYHLILEEIVKHYNSFGRQNILTAKKALEVMSMVAQQVNEIQRRYEDAVHVQEIQSILTDWKGDDHLTSFGSIRMEGELRMLGARDLRQLFLMDQILLVTKITEAGFLQHKAHIFLGNLILLENLAKDPLAFQVAPHDNTFPSMTFVAQTLEKKHNWIRALKEAVIDSYQESVPKRAKSQLLSLDDEAARHDHMLKLMTPPMYEKNDSLALRRKISFMVAPGAGNNYKSRGNIYRKNNENLQLNPNSAFRNSVKLVSREEIENIRDNVRVYFKESAEELRSTQSMMSLDQSTPAMFDEDRSLGIPLGVGDIQGTFNTGHMYLERCKSEDRMSQLAALRNRKISNIEERMDVAKEVEVIPPCKPSRRYIRRSSSSLSQFSKTSRPRPENTSGTHPRQASVEDERESAGDTKLNNSDEHDTSSDYTSSIVETQRREFLIRRSKSASFGVGQRSYFQKAEFNQAYNGSSISNLGQIPTVSSKIQEVPRTAISTEVLRRNSIEINGKKWKDSQSTAKASPIRTRLLRWLLACWSVTTKNRFCKKKSSSKESLSGVDSAGPKKSPIHANLCKSLSEGNTSSHFESAAINPVLFPMSPKVSSTSIVGKTVEPKLTEVNKVPMISVDKSGVPDIPPCIQPENTFLPTSPEVFLTANPVLPPNLSPTASNADSVLLEHVTPPPQTSNLEVPTSNLSSTLPLPTTLPQIVPASLPTFLNPVLPQTLQFALSPKSYHPDRSFNSTSYLRNPKSVSRDNSRYNKNEMQIARKTKLLGRSASLQSRKANDDSVIGAKAKVRSRKLSDLTQSIDFIT